METQNESKAAERLSAIEKKFQRLHKAKKALMEIADTPKEEEEIKPAIAIIETKILAVKKFAGEMVEARFKEIENKF